MEDHLSDFAAAGPAPRTALVPGRHNILGVAITATDYARTCAAVRQAAVARQPLTVTALAVHGVMTGALDAEHRRRLNALDLVVPDGQPVRWALNLMFRAGLKDRVYGPDLTLRICQMAEAEGLPIAFYGSKPEVLDDLRENLLARFPNLKIAAMLPSRFRRVGPEEQAAIAQDLAESGAQILFVGLGCPRQEVWVYEHRETLRMPQLAVGAAFDFHAARLAQAPGWMQDRGLEWLFRLFREPRRLWRRYLLLNPLYVTLLLLQAVGLRRVSEDAETPLPRYEGYA
ncbi:WecB/TagA/CpsF family glycosyltransferase [Dankookia sp. P2]|uniref:WecB/TagA/CpsF family glycosyltransferase n=1 Tax=Dankookia sp. P2 TaxID=3423955 RepID=UPI003D67AB57